MLTKKEIEMRKTGIGASEIAAVIGISRWRTPMDVWLEKTGAIETPDLNDNPHIYWGNRLEDVVASEFARRNGLKLTKKTTTRHAEAPWMLATPDRLIYDDKGELIGGLECKTAGSRSADQWGEEGTDDIPFEYILQVTQNMLVFGLKEWNVAVLIEGSDYREYKIPLSQQIADNIFAHGTAFWFGNVVSKVAPEARTAGDVVNLYRESNPGKVVEADAMIVQACTSLAAAKIALDHAEKRVEGLSTQIKAFMGNADTLKDPFENTVLATWKSSVQKRFDAKTLQANQPEIYNQYVALSPRRTFLLKVKE